MQTFPYQNLIEKIADENSNSLLKVFFFLRFYNEMLAYTSKRLIEMAKLLSVGCGLTTMSTYPLR